MLPTGRNLHGFDPFRIPSAFAVRGRRAPGRALLARHAEDGGNALPETVALVLWGTDNLKTEGGADRPGAGADGRQAALRQLRPPVRARADPAGELGRPRIDVVITLSGIFRDLLPLQTACWPRPPWLAASADEPVER
jgi:magnesium chelatase subunit H